MNLGFENGILAVIIGIFYFLFGIIIYKFGFDHSRKSGKFAKKYGIIVKTVPLTYPNGIDVVFNGHFPYKSGFCFQI